MKLSIALGGLVALLPSALAVSEWGQCGGIGWTGGTTCDAGLVCAYQNDWYSQCLPPSTTSSSSTKASSSSSTSKSTSTSKTSSTSSSSVKSTSTSSSKSSSTSSTKVSSSSSTTKSSTSAVASATGNPYSGWNVWASTYYASEVYAAAAQVTDTALKAKISKVALIPTFTWFDTMAKVADMPGYLTAASGKIFQFVVYDLPNRDCHANASNGELTYANNGAALYQQYIDSMVSAIQGSSGTRAVAVVEPDSLANLVTNLSDSRCSSVQTQYKASVVYAAQHLAAVGVYLYLDAGHAGWLGWTSNLSPAATLFAEIWTSAGKSSYIRGLATDVANYNSLTTTSPDPITAGDPCYDELLYVQALQPLLVNAGWNAQFIVDQGRSGVQNIRNQWGDWCNIKGAGFGIRPTTDTGSALIDAIVWVKPGGECDGTSNSSAARFDSTCALSDAKQPSPEAGTWFQDYFIDLVNNANPAL